MRVYRHGFLSPDEKASNEKENNAVVLERIRQRRAFFTARGLQAIEPAALTFNVSDRTAICFQITDQSPSPTAMYALIYFFFFPRRL